MSRRLSAVHAGLLVGQLQMTAPPPPKNVELKKTIKELVKEAATRLKVPLPPIMRGERESPDSLLQSDPDNEAVILTVFRMTF